MTILASDNFNRANGAIGANWNNQHPGNTTLVAGNAATPTDPGNDCGASYNAYADPPNDQYAAAKISTNATGTEAGYGVCVRSTLSDNQYSYVAFVSHAASNNVTIACHKSYTYTLLAQRTVTWNDGDTLALQVSGSSPATLKVFRNGVQLGADITDATTPITGNEVAGGFWGLWGFGGQTSCSADDWEAGDTYSAGSATPATTGQGSQSAAASGTVNNPVVIQVTEPVPEIVSTTNVATYDFASVTPPINSVICVLALCRGTVATGSMVNVSGTSLTWTKKGSGTFNAGADTAYCFWARTPASTAASVYRVDVTGDNATGCIAYMFEATNADLTSPDPIIQLVTNSGTSTNPTGSFAAARRTNSATVAAWMGALSSSNPANVSTPPTNWTEIGDNGFATPTSNASGAYKATGETAQAVTFTAASTTWGFIAAEIRSTLDVIVGAAATSQKSQTVSASGSQTITGTATTGQGSQTVDAEGSSSLSTSNLDYIKYQQFVTAGTRTSDTLAFISGGTSRGILVLSGHGGLNTDRMPDGSVVYGGVNVPRFRIASDTAGQSGNVYGFFLGAGVPQGNQNCVVTYSASTGTSINHYIVELSGSVNLEIVTSGVAENDQANPSVVLSVGGRQAYAFSLLYSGADAVATDVTAGAGVSKLGQNDYGTNGTVLGLQTAGPSASDFTFGWTVASNDVAMIAVSIAEVITSITGTATTSQKSQSVIAAGTEAISGTAATAQRSQSSTATGTQTQTITGTATTSQRSQSAVASGSGAVVAGGITTSQGSQSSNSAGIQTIAGTATTSQKSQSILAGVQIASGTATTSQKSQSVIAAGTESIAGTATTSQKSQTVAVAVEVRPAVRLQWDDVAWAEDGYRVKWGTSPGTYTQTADVGPNVLEYTIWGLIPNTTYYWTVVGLSSGVEQTPAPESTFHTIPSFITTSQRQSVTAAGSVRITGTATSGQGSQSTVVVASAQISGTAATSQKSQSATASGSAVTSGTITTSQKSQSISAVGGTPPVSGGITTGQGSQSALVAAQELLTGVTVVWQGTQSVLSAGSVAIAGTGTTSQKSQSAVAAGAESIAGTASTAQRSQSAIGNTQVVTGTASTAQRGQNASAVGAGAGNSGIVITGQSQSVVAAGAQTIAGTATSGQGGQSATAIGAETITGTGATSQKSQSLSGVGAGAAISGPATTSQGSQSITVAAYVLMTGVATTGQGLQSASGSGAAPPIVGTASSAQRSQGVSSSGSVAIAGTSATGQGSQRAQAAGISWVEGAGATRQTQSAAGSGSLVITGTASTGQGGQSTKGGVSSYREFDIVTEDGKFHIYSILYVELLTSIT